MDTYWGEHTQRALENFPLGCGRLHPQLLRSLALVKKACCQANAELGFLDKAKARLIEQSCDEIIAGGLGDQFPLDALQGGAGTSANMNINEVIAHRAGVHPIEDVNKHQSTNDVFPTALKVAAIAMLRELSAEIANVQGVLQEKEQAFAGIVTIGRTELQEAVPMTLGAEFGAFSQAWERDRWRVFKCEERLRVVNLGGTAVGTGLTAPREYIFLVIEKLRSLTGMGLSRAENMVDQTANSDCFVEVSGMLKAHASNVVKVCNDLRLLNLLGEIKLAKVQAGSSIMPGKVNPVVLESAIQAALVVAANDGLVFQACSRASLQINEFMPLLAHSFLGSLELLLRVNRMLAAHVKAIEADAPACRSYLEKSPMIITALLPQIGYSRAEKLLEEFRCESAAAPAGKQRTIKEFLAERLGSETVEKALSAQALTRLGFTDGNNG